MWRTSWRNLCRDETWSYTGVLQPPSVYCFSVWLGVQGIGFLLLWGCLGGFPGGASGKEPSCHCRRHKRLRFYPWVRKIPWKRARQPTPVFLPGEFPWTEEPSALQSMGSQRVRHDWATKHSTAHVCLSLSHLLLTPSMLLPMAFFHSFLWLSNIALYIYATSSLSIHLSMGI